MSDWVAGQGPPVAYESWVKAVIERDQWKRLAVHALHDLRTVGVPIEKISGVTPEVIAAVDEYDREMESFT